MEATKCTTTGHDLLGAIGFTFSHQVVLRHMLDNPCMIWALVLEDDATLTNMPGLDTRN